MVLQSNIMAMNAHRGMLHHQSMVSKSLQRLSSGFRINSAADDPAGLAISERMRGQIRGLSMAVRNAHDEIALLQTAEGGLNETHSLLQRMRELAVQASNGTYSDEDRRQLALEYEELKKEVTRISDSTHYNGIKLLNGTAGGKTGEAAQEQLGISSIDTIGEISGNGILLLQLQQDSSGLATLRIGDNIWTADLAAGDTQAVFDLGDSRQVTLAFDAGPPRTGAMSNIVFSASGVGLAGAMGANDDSELIAQIGANGGQDQRIGIHIDNMSAENLGLSAGLGSLADSNINDIDSANSAIDIVEAASRQVSGQRAGIGAKINRLEHTINNLENSIENLTRAESTIRDADMAAEMMTFTKHSILLQAAQAMLAQAMQLPNGILQLLNSL